MTEELSLPLLALPAAGGQFRGASLETALLATDFEPGDIHSDLYSSPTNRFAGELETLRNHFPRLREDFPLSCAALYNVLNSSNQKRPGLTTPYFPVLFPFTVGRISSRSS
jgi:hypothetical protein